MTTATINCLSTGGQPHVLHAVHGPSRLVLAPRFEAGILLGLQVGRIVEVFDFEDSRANYFLVRFSDGHEAGAFPNEIKAHPCAVDAYLW